MYDLYSDRTCPKLIAVELISTVAAFPQPSNLAQTSAGGGGRAL